MAREDRRLELAIAAVPVLLVLMTMVIVFDPRVAPAVVNQPLDVAITAVGMLVSLAVAILGWIHFREGSDPSALIRASAFLVLAAQNALLIAVMVLGIDAAFGLSLEAPGQLPLWSVILSRGTAAALLGIAGVATLRRWQSDAWPAALVLALPALLVTAAIVVAATIQPSLPDLLSGAGMAQLRRDPTSPLLAASGLGLIGLQALIGLAMLAAAALRYQVYRRDRRRVDAYLAVGFIVAAFSQVHAAIHPGSYSSLVTSGDLLRFAFYAIMLIAVAVETRQDVRDLHTANVELARLHDAAAMQATAEERARLAREIHDGMSQQLWLARLKQGRLLQEGGLSAEALVLAADVTGSIDSAMDEARQAILALRPAEESTFAEVMERYVDEFSDRFGIPAERDIDPIVERLGPRAQAELLRIAQEAFANARKHADATRVSVQAEPTPDGLRLTVTDNGRGFEPGAGGSRGYGLHSMRERAELIGASLVIDSRPQDGTRVIVDVPLPRAAQ
ncbi:MAG: sensor histidine kinase [Chloroflexota bacterium]